MQLKHFILVGTVALGPTLGAAETDSITTRNGITYTNAVIQRADPDGVVIEYVPQPGSVGLAKLKFANLPDELRKRYNYNATDAVTFEQNQIAGIGRRQEAIAQGEIERKRKNDEFVQQRREEAELEAKWQKMAGMVAARMQMEGGYGGYSSGYYSDGDGDWFGTGQRRFRFNSRDPFNPQGFLRDGLRDDSTDFSNGVGLSDLGQHWDGSGHWGPLPSQEFRGSSPSGAIHNPAARGTPPARGFSAKAR